MTSTKIVNVESLKRTCSFFKNLLIFFVMLYAASIITLRYFGWFEILTKEFSFYVIVAFLNVTF